MLKPNINFEGESFIVKGLFHPNQYISHLPLVESIHPDSLDTMEMNGARHLKHLRIVKWI